MWVTVQATRHFAMRNTWTLHSIYPFPSSLSLKPAKAPDTATKYF